MPPRAAVRHLTPEELAERLGATVTQLRDWRSAGRGPAYIRGDSDGDKAYIGYPVAEVEAWESSHLVRPAGT